MRWRRLVILGLALAVGVLALAFRPVALASWQTRRLLSLPWGAGGVAYGVGMDGKRYGPTDFFWAEDALYIVDPFAGRIDRWRAGEGLREVLRIPAGTAAAALVGGHIAWVDELDGSVGVGRRIVGRLPVPPEGVLSVLSFQGSGPLAYLLVRTSDLAGADETLYVVSGDGLRELGHGVEGVAVVPGRETFYFMRQGHVFAPNGRRLIDDPPGILIGVDRAGRPAFLVYGRRNSGRVYLASSRSSFTLPSEDVVLGTRASVLPDGALIWAWASERGLSFYRTTRVYRWTVRRRF